MPDSVLIRPSILYFGTPVVLITTRNPDGSTNITPMSSAWALADHVVIGLAGGGQGLANLLREGECVLNLAGVDQHAAVERLAPTSGYDPVPAWKREVGYRHEADKFALAGWHALPSLAVAVPRIAECPLQAGGAALPRPPAPDRGMAGHCGRLHRAGARSAAHTCAHRHRGTRHATHRSIALSPTVLRVPPLLRLRPAARSHIQGGGVTRCTAFQSR